MLRTCQHRAGTPRLARAPVRSDTVRVERARLDELVGFLGHRLEEQGVTGEVEGAVDGAKGDPGVGVAPEHLFVWCAPHRTVPVGQPPKRRLARLDLAQ
jgi:hypothetical protein